MRRPKAAPKSGAVSDLLELTKEQKRKVEIRIAEEAAQRLFESEKILFYNICLKLGLDEAERIFSQQPKLILSNRQRERLNKELVETTRKVVIRNTPKMADWSENKQAAYLAKLISTNDTPEYREMMGLLAIVVRGFEANPPKRGKRRYSRITHGGVRKQLGRRKAK
jgi:hypothetical protein